MLEQVITDVELSALKYYHLANAKAAAVPLQISRTGYTGDLGYELWVEPENAIGLWDMVMEAGEPYGAQAAGILALDIARIEAGLIMLQVDYISARKAHIPAQKSSPYEIGMGWAVELDKVDFIGQKALRQQKEGGSPWKFIGLEVDWESLEAVYAQYRMYLGRIVEHAKADELFEKPLHPYTELLLASAPQIMPSGGKRTREAPLTGEVPRPVNIPSGCYFSPEVFRGSAPATV